MRFASLLMLVAGAALASAEVTLTMYMRDEVVGEATLNQRLLPDGGKQLTMTMTFNRPKPGAVNIRNESVYAADGSPVRMIYEFNQSGQPKNLVTAIFSEKGAAVTERKGTESTNRVIARPDGPIKNLAEHWFIATQPKPGDVLSAYVFSAVEQEWRLHTSTYKGKKTVTIDGQKFAGHLLVSGTRGKEISSIVDDRGLPLIVEGPVRLVRKVSGSK